LVSAPDPRPHAPLLGRWTYRSFNSNPEVGVDFNELEFGRGELLVEYLCRGTFVGRLILAEDFQFRLNGIAVPGDPPTLRFHGVGDAEGSQGQTYDYLACVMPMWPHETRYRLVMTGSVIRGLKEGEELPPVRQASTFIAVKRDLPFEPPPEEEEEEEEETPPEQETTETQPAQDTTERSDTSGGQSS
jgi:hypothetical protein